MRTKTLSYLVFIGVAELFSYISTRGLQTNKMIKKMLRPQQQGKKILLTTRNAFSKTKAKRNINSIETNGV